MQQRKKRRGLFGTILLTAILVTAVFAYTSSVTFGSGSNASVAYGTEVSSGYEVTNVDWTVDAVEPIHTSAVSFGINSATADVKVMVTAADAAWRDCVNTAGSVLCTFSSPVLVTEISKLSVYAEG
jgi:hypothetical protein